MVCNEPLTKSYLLICEIGPISDFVTHSRKTIDFWGASFIFSYIMAEIAIKVEFHDFGGEVFLPYLKDNPMVIRKEKIVAGSVPDQLYILLNSSNIEKVDSALKKVFFEIIEDIAKKAEKELSLSLNHNEINNFFDFFYIIHEIKDKKPSYNDFIEAERKIKIRALLKKYSKNLDDEGFMKWDKCSLCGNREKVKPETPDKEKAEPTDEEFKPYSKEHFCSVCLVKRYLYEILSKNIKIVNPQYNSTSDFAAIPIQNYLITIDNLFKSNELLELLNELKAEHEKLKNEYQSKTKDYTNNGRYFFKTSLTFLQKFRKSFERIEDEIKVIDKDKKHTPFKWLDRPFYAIVYIDGDNMGEILKANAQNFNIYIKEVSRLLSEFSVKVNDIIKDNKGQLIFAGGEDINFIIHPEYLFKCLQETNQLYNGYFSSNEITQNNKEKFTLSAGVCVAYHKYPLTQTIQIAGEMLHNKAKKYPGKNTTAISLIKGHTETLSFCVPNNSIKDVIALKSLFLKADISRAAAYKIKESEEIIKLIKDERIRKNYIYNIIAGSRSLEKKNRNINEIVDLLMKFIDEDHLDRMINTLLYVRFLTGDK